MSIVKKFFVTFALILLTCSTCAAEDPFDVIASTYSEGADAALTLIKTKDSGEIYFMVHDESIKALSLVKFDRKLYDFYLNKDSDGGYPPLMFVMVFPEENRGGADEKLGVWKENMHGIPIYALFNVQGEQITFDAPNFYSGEETLTPSHYHSNITEPVHTRLIEIFMTHMPELHKQAQGVQLP